MNSGNDEYNDNDCIDDYDDDDYEYDDPYADERDSLRIGGGTWF